jgi:signal peptidase I
MEERLYFDFAAALVLMTAVTGVVYLLDVAWLARRRAALTLPGFPVPKPNAFVEFCRSFFPVILIVLLLRSFVVEPFRIPSGSMLPTLNVGDFILVNKFSYGLRLPVLHKKILEVGEPQRGDVIVFRYPPDPSKDYIKRVVGLPGDEIRYEDKVLYINGERVPTDDMALYTGYGAGALGVPTLEMTEWLGELQHQILVVPRRLEPDLRERIPPGHYFVMGDNRDNSADSREWGLVPESHLVGKAFMIWMSWDATRFRPDFTRIGMSIR